MLWCLFERLHVTKNKKLCFRRTPWGFSISVSYVTFMIRYWLPSDILFTSDTCRMSCHTSCHTDVTRLVTRFCLLTSATYRMSCHTIVLQVIYLKSYRFKSSFLPFPRLPWGQHFKLNVTRVSCSDSKQFPSMTVCLNDSAIHKHDVQRNLYSDTSNMIIIYFW